MVRTVATAAGGQGCVIAIADGEGQRFQPEGQDQEDGEHAPHLANILHELWDGWRFWHPLGFRYHRSILLPDFKRRN
jgi:hypothetical protein